jgi:hypothetical protein
MDNPEKLATRRRKIKQTHNKICVGHHYAQTNTYNVNKTTGGKDHHIELKHCTHGVKQP